MTTSKTPEASISVALSRDPILFERIAPSTYCVRPGYRKDPADAESVIAAAKDKILRYANGFLADQNADEEERDDDSESDVAEGTEVDALSITLVANKNGACSQVVSDSGKLPNDGLVQNKIGGVGKNLKNVVLFFVATCFLCLNYETSERDHILTTFSFCRYWRS